MALEARFLCSGDSGRLKHALFYSKLKFFSIKVESNLLYRTRIARKFFIVTRILEKAVKHGSKVFGHNSL